MKRLREHQGKKFGVKLWIPPERLLEVAANRTDGMLGYFYSNGACSIETAIRNLRDLVRAAYLQGLTDMADAVARNEKVQLLDSEN